MSASRRPQPDFKATYQATINTNRGAIVIDLLNSKATCTVNSFVFLAQKRFFNNTICPRLVTYRHLRAPVRRPDRYRHRRPRL